MGSLPSEQRRPCQACPTLVISLHRGPCPISFFEHQHHPAPAPTPTLDELFSAVAKNHITSDLSDATWSRATTSQQAHWPPPWNHTKSHEITRATRATRATTHRCRFFCRCCCIPGLLVTQNCAKDSGSPCPSCAMTASARPNRRPPVVGRRPGLLPAASCELQSNDHAVRPD